MNWRRCLLALVTMLALTVAGHADTHESTRVVDADQHASDARGRYPYRDKSTYVLEELDLRAGDVVVDIGAGDGFWTGQMAKAVGRAGVVHAGEVDREKIDKLTEQFRATPQITSTICATSARSSNRPDAFASSRDTRV